IEHLIGQVVSRLLHTDQRRSLGLLLVLSERAVPNADRQGRVLKAIAGNLSVLWVTYESAEAKAILDRWLAAPWRYTDLVRTILATLRSALVAGIGDALDKKYGLRQRARTLVSDIVSSSNAGIIKHLSGSDSDDVATEE